MNSKQRDKLIKEVFKRDKEVVIKELIKPIKELIGDKFYVNCEYIVDDKIFFEIKSNGLSIELKGEIINVVDLVAIISSQLYDKIQVGDIIE